MIIGGEVVDGDTVEIENVDETLKFNIKKFKEGLNCDRRGIKQMDDILL